MRLASAHSSTASSSSANTAPRAKSHIRHPASLMHHAHGSGTPLPPRYSRSAGISMCFSAGSCSTFKPPGGSRSVHIHLRRHPSRQWNIFSEFRYSCMLSATRFFLASCTASHAGGTGFRTSSPTSAATTLIGTRVLPLPTFRTCSISFVIAFHRSASRAAFFVRFSGSSRATSTLKPFQVYLCFPAWRGPCAIGPFMFAATSCATVSRHISCRNIRRFTSRRNCSHASSCSRHNGIRVDVSVTPDPPARASATR